MSANHENDLSLGRRYKKYEGAYNLAFAADPIPQLRRFDEMAPKDDPQWKRLEVFRGNDREAFHAHKSNPNDALVRPTDKEQAMWDANQQDKWRIDREPAFDQHPMTNNKWFDMSLEQRRSDASQNYFNGVEQRHGDGYEAWAAKAGSNVVAKGDYLQTMASLDIEKAQAARAQKQASQAESVQQEMQTPATEQQAATKRTRLSLAEFQGTTGQYIEQRARDLASLPDEGLRQVNDQTKADYQARGLGRIEDAGPRIQAINAFHAREQQQRNTPTQEVSSEAFTQRRTRQQ
ncbi:hypothetical protein [Stenotrophomonas sp. GD03937]|uniref:hypothetical protein n=1 Tax=Stenotrophomonas sp. GD03937 TaxID=2975408 RepID=UPI00244C7A60|nr:hypothetical protein [Stenotrophomonas sp. GD03937]MDH1274110.1 hypothetical protein [Stenotrophomonas sp. GD03937]